jgi:hypothetical protein
MPSLGFGCTSGRDPTSGMLQRYKRSVSMSSFATKNGPEVVIAFLPLPRSVRDLPFLRSDIPRAR